MANLSQVKEVLEDLFIATAKKHKVANSQVHLVFKLKRIDKFICRYGEHEVHFSDAGMLVGLYSGKINKFISAALVELANKNSIPLPDVNVLMNMNAQFKDKENLFVLILRNGNNVIRDIEVEELLKM